MNYFSHETALVDEGAKIGRNSKVWHFSHICGGAVIGEDVTIGQNVYVGNDVEIGNRCKIHTTNPVYKGVAHNYSGLREEFPVNTNVKNPQNNDYPFVEWWEKRTMHEGNLYPFQLTFDLKIHFILNPYKKFQSE